MTRQVAGAVGVGLGRRVVADAPHEGEVPAAQEALYACYAALDCEGLESPDACAEEQQAVETGCE